MKRMNYIGFIRAPLLVFVLLLGNRICKLQLFNVVFSFALSYLLKQVIKRNQAFIASSFGE